MFPREKFLDSSGRPITQSLFLEIGYTEHAIYTLKDQDHKWEGKLYPSLKRLYLEKEDVTEYDFATEYLLGWKHWQRICENKQIKLHVEEWREELEYKLRSRSTKQMIDLAASGSYQAAKWVADRGWDVRPAGRPSKAEKEKANAIGQRIADEYSADVIRLNAKQG